MVKKNSVAIPVVVILLLILLSGCVRETSVKDLSPEEVVTQFWSDIAGGDYDHAYDLAYHSNPSVTKQVWVDEHMSKWGEDGSYIKIYSFNVTDTSPVNSSMFAGNFSEAVMVNTNATIAYRGQNETGQLRMTLVNTTDGWKILGNY